MQQQTQTQHDSLVLSGGVVGSTPSQVSVELHPGFVVDIDRRRTGKIEEAVDPSTGAVFTRVALRRGIAATQIGKARLARLLEEMGAQGTPFGLGGQMPHPIAAVGPTDPAPTPTPTPGPGGSTTCYDESKTTFWTHDWKADDVQ